MQPLPDEFDILHYVRIADARKNPMLPLSSFGVPDAKNTLNIIESIIFM